MTTKHIWLFHAAIFGVIGLAPFNFALAMGIILAAVTAVYIWATLEASKHPPISPYLEQYKLLMRRLAPNANNADT